ncbi:MAG: polysaccharide biosynthesis/export family protein [Desulfobacula sp.]|uniref:polysaccharide biosynthesis/export family protein n=1 Tax=Desulfobacula sp. TaxID=2593537 RepID=UPI0025BAA815|nr:polysaccharide biosynthesis/export family protein [Desulfobacula sp.]MCD4719606.1 polysaccharide biosynthesis/export family protein [Desulfobacula sp.]
MKRKIVILTAAVFLFAAAVSAAYAGDYRIGPGDVLDISVWKNPDLTKQLAVLPDGMIHFPLVKELKVGGITVNELEKMLVDKLKKYVPEPDLSISVVQVNSMMIYVIGKVNHPGRFSINTNIDVMQALAVAGGLNPFAKEKEIVIFRKRDGKTISFNFNYEEASEGKNLAQNIMLVRGDVIVVR